jgi:hypothetical protein
MRTLLIASALALSGCAAVAPTVIDTIVSLAKPAEAVGDKVVLEGTRGLVIAHNGYQAALALASAAVRSDKLNPSQVDMIEKADAQVAYYMTGAGKVLPMAERAAAILNAQNNVLVALGR